MNLNKLKVFGTLQDGVMNRSEGKIPLVTFYQEEHGISVHNPFMDTTGRFEVDPLKEYGNEALAYMDAEIKKIESEMEIGIEEINVNDLLLYFGGKFYQGKEPSLKCFEKIYFEDEPIFLQNEETNISETLNFYVPLFEGFEELIPEAALTYVVPKDDAVEVNLYLDYNIENKEVSLSWISKHSSSPKEGVVKIPESAKEEFLVKIDSYVKEWGEDGLEEMVSNAVNTDIWHALEKAVKEEWYATPDENGNYHVEISADYRESNEGLLETAYDNRESVELKNIIMDEINNSYEEAISCYEYALLDKAGFGVDSPYHEQAREMLYEKISFSPDYDHFMSDDMKVNLLLGTDWERNVDFSDIKENLARWIDKDALAEMKANAVKYDSELREPDNALIWLIKQQGYTLEDLGKVNEAYKEFFYGEEDTSKKYGSYEKAYKEFETVHSPLLSSICECLDNQTYSMGCVTVLMKSSLDEYCELFERSEESNELVPKEIMISKDAYVTLHNPWDGAGCMGWIGLEKDLVVPNSIIFDSEIEGVKRDYGWTVDGISGLVGTCWKESKGVREVQSEVKNPSVDEMIHRAASRSDKEDPKKSHKDICKDTSR